jgi:hypothetical protein
MRKIIIIAIVIIVLAVVGLGLYLTLAPKNNASTNTGSGTGSDNGQTGTLPTSTATTNNPTNLPDYIGQASEIYSAAPTGTQLSIGTAQGTVSMNNFYTANPPVVDGGTIIIKQTPNYAITYDPNTDEFWLAILGTPFVTWQTAAEQDFLTTLGVSEADACKLDVTSGVVYSPGDPNDGKDFPLSFCGGNSAFQSQPQSPSQ